MTQPMVADRLHITLAAVKAQVNDIYKKLETHSLQEALNKLVAYDEPES